MRKQILIAFIIASLATLASAGCPFQAKEQRAKEITKGCPYAALVKSAVETTVLNGAHSKCPFYQLFAKCPFFGYMRKKSINGDGKCVFTEFIKSRRPVDSFNVGKCPFYELTSRCPIYVQLKSKLSNGGAISKCPLYKKLTSCPILKQMTQDKLSDGKCAFAEYIKQVQPLGGSNSKCPFYELFSKCPLFQRLKAPSVAGDGRCPIYSITQAAKLANSKCPLFKTIKTLSPSKQEANAQKCPIYKVFGRCPVATVVKSAVRGDGKCAFIHFVKSKQPSGGAFSKCPYYELVGKCPLFKDVITKLSKSSLAKCPLYQKFAKCPLLDFAKNSAVKGKCPLIELMNQRQSTGGATSKCPFYELFSNCPLYRNVKNAAVSGDGKCPFAGITRTLLNKVRNSNCPIFKSSNLFVGRSDANKCPYYGLFRKCPLSSIIKTANKGDGKCVVVEYIKKNQANGGSNSKCPFYEFASKCPLYEKLKSKLSLGSADKCPLYKLFAKCPLFTSMKQNKGTVGKCAFIEYMKINQPTGGNVSGCPFYESFSKCPLSRLMAKKSFVSGDGKCVFVDYFRSVKDKALFLKSEEVQLLKQSWKVLKRKSDLAPKIFLQYFKENPQSMELFPEIANVTLVELPNNRDFLHRVYTCFASLNRLMSHIDKTSLLHQCPAANLKAKYNMTDLEVFGRIFFEEIKTELGEDFTPMTEKAWIKVLSALKTDLSQ